MQAVKRALKQSYRKYLYQSMKRLEKGTRWIVFSFLRFTIPRFNSFRFFGIPSGIDRSTGEIVFPSVTEERQPPHTVEEDLHPRFNELRVVAPAGELRVVERGVAAATAAHLDGKGKLLAHFTQQFSIDRIENHKLFTFRLGRAVQTIPRIEGKVASLVIDCHNNYFHWLFDVIPKIAILREKGLHPDKFYVHTEKTFQKETLRLLGITEEHLIAPEKHPFISADELLVTTFAANGAPTKWVCDFLKKNFLPENISERGRRLYVSRGDATYRTVVNEKELLPLLERRGFETVIPGNLSVAEQARIFAEAEIVVAPHGAALANLVFCSPGTKVIEMFTPRTPTICYWALANVCKLPYTFLQGEKKIETYSEQDPAYDDLFVDPQKLEQTLSLACDEIH